MLSSFASGAIDKKKKKKKKERRETHPRAFLYLSKKKKKKKKRTQKRERERERERLRYGEKKRNVPSQGEQKTTRKRARDGVFDRRALELRANGIARDAVVSRRLLVQEAKRGRCD